MEKYFNGQFIENISDKFVNLERTILLIFSGNILTTSGSKYNFEKPLILTVNHVILNIFDLYLLMLMLTDFASLLINVFFSGYCGMYCHNVYVYANVQLVSGGWYLLASVPTFYLIVSFFQLDSQLLVQIPKRNPRAHYL